MRISRGTVVAIATTTVGVLWFAAPVSAHVGVDKDEIEAGASTQLSFSFSHGCEDSPTNSMQFQIPEGVNNATAQVHPGWDVEIERAELAEPIESSHGEEITERVSVITYTAQDGFEVPGDLRDTFTLSFRAPDTEGMLAFPIIQGCVDGSNDWIEVWDGTGDEPERPAPSVMVVAGAGAESGGHGHAEEETSDTTAPSDTTVTIDTDDSSDDGGSNALAIGGIVLGAAGLGVGGVALSRSGGKSKDVSSS